MLEETKKIHCKSSVQPMAIMRRIRHLVLPLEPSHLHSPNKLLDKELKAHAVTIDKPDKLKFTDPVTPPVPAIAKRINPSPHPIQNHKKYQRELNKSKLETNGKETKISKNKGDL